jgi:hypothetical protein
MLTLVVVAILFAYVAFFSVLGMAGGALLVGAPLTEINCFFGPTLKQVKLGKVTLTIRSLPIGGYIKFSDEFNNLHPAKRMFVACSCSLSLLVLATLVFGISSGFSLFVKGFVEIMYGALSFPYQGPNYLFKLIAFIKTNSYWAIMGLIASKLAAYNLLPLPGVNGLTVLLILLEPLPSRVTEIVRAISNFLMVGVFALWALAIVIFLIRLFG